MKKVTLVFLFFIICVQSTWADIAVIGNINSQIKSLHIEEVQDIYMGRKRALPNGKMSLPLDQSELRSDFYLKLTNRPVEQINAYWARIMFSGQASPPVILSDDKTVIRTVKENSGAMGYISNENVPRGVRVLLVIK